MWLFALVLACVPAARRITPPPPPPPAPTAEAAAPALAAALTGRVLELQGHPAEALPYYELALRYDADDPWLMARRAALTAASSPRKGAPALAERGRAKLAAGDLDGAVADLGGALGLWVEEGAALPAEDLVCWTTAVLQSRRYGTALASLERWTAARPGDAILALVRAQLAREAGDHRALMAALDALARLEPSDPTLDLERARLCLLVEDPQGALNILGPRDPRTDPEGAALVAEAKRARKGRAAAPQAPTSAPAPPPDLAALEGRSDIASLLALAALRAEAGQVDLALASWEAVLAKDPGNPAANLGMAGALLAGTRPDLTARALGHATRATEAAPGCGEAWELRARAAEARGQTDSAEFARRRAQQYSGPWSRCP